MGWFSRSRKLHEMLWVPTPGCNSSEQDTRLSPIRPTDRRTLRCLFSRIGADENRNWLDCKVASRCLVYRLCSSGAISPSQRAGL